ncbi:MAG: hypothetical protein HY055_16045 [Magnetospirillum sp.]|nr:hypothetical protein [Magnetospirillum sp.]
MSEQPICYIVAPSTFNGWDNYIYDVVAERNARYGIATRKIVGPFPTLPDIRQFNELVSGGNHGPYYIFTINRILDVCHVLAKQPRLLTQVDCPVVSYMVDNIGRFAGTICEVPIEREIRVVADARGEEIMSAVASHLPSSLFFPMWGLPRDPTPPHAPAERDIDLLFIGNITPVAEAERDAVTTARGHPDLVDFIHECAQAQLATRGNQDPAILTLYLLVSKSMLQRHSIDVPWFSEIFRASDTLARAHFREGLLRKFKKARLTIVGTGAEHIAASQPNITLLGAKPLTEMAAICQRAKLLLGDLAGFTGGVELRPSLAMSNGAGYIGETNPYLSQTVPSHCRIEDGGDLEDAALGAIAAPAALRAMTEQAGAVYDQLVQDNDLPFLPAAVGQLAKPD